MPVDVKQADMTEVKCPYCGWFYDYVTPKSFYGSQQSIEVRCRNYPHCGKPFVIQKRT